MATRKSSGGTKATAEKKPRTATRRQSAKSPSKRQPAKSAKSAADAPKVSGQAKLLGALTLGGIAAAAVAAALGLFRRRPVDGTGPTDLMGDEHPDGSERAIPEFRPDPTAPVPPGERDDFRPALAGGAAPTLGAGQARDLRRTDAPPS